jgi:cupin fold WbuC family metalloprotein
MRTISDSDIAALMAQAEQSPRKRAIFRLHEHHEPVQRMVNAILPGSYVQPHKHENPDKVELFSILVGKVACLQFDASGVVEEVYVLDTNGTLKIVDIAPRIYHTLIALQPSALLEIIQGPYEAQTHKTFAHWSPAENTPGVAEYLARLETIVREWNR